MPKSGKLKTSNATPEAGVVEPLRADGAPITSYLFGSVGEMLVASESRVAGIVRAGGNRQRLTTGDTVSSDLVWASVESSTSEVLGMGETTMDRGDARAPVVSITTGVMQLAYFTARTSEAITKIAGYTGGTAATLVTLARFGVYEVEENGNLTLVASTVSDTNLFTDVDSRYEKTLSATWNKVTGTVYAVGALCISTVSPILIGKSSLSATAFGTMYAFAPRRSGELGLASDIGELEDLPLSVLAEDVHDCSGIPYIEMLR